MALAEARSRAVPDGGERAEARPHAVVRRPEDPYASTMETCRYVVGYEREVPGSDVADPRIRCGEPATVQLESGMWVCAKHARLLQQRSE